MNTLQFRLLDINDIYDPLFNDGFAWSRVYEYPLVLKVLKDLGANQESLIHNSSWGWDDVHIRFKLSLDNLYPNTIHSDVRESNLPKTFLYDITKAPTRELEQKFDFVINISTVEEVNFNHATIISNLLSQVKDGGYLIITFDFPGLDVNLVSNYLNSHITISPNPLTGRSSKLQNLRYEHLSCGLLVIKK